MAAIAVAVVYAASQLFVPQPEAMAGALAAMNLAAVVPHYAPTFDQTQAWVRNYTLRLFYERADTTVPVANLNHTVDIAELAPSSSTAGTVTVITDQFSAASTNSTTTYSLSHAPTSASSGNVSTRSAIFGTPSSTTTNNTVRSTPAAINETQPGEPWLAIGSIWPAIVAEWNDIAVPFWISINAKAFETFQALLTTLQSVHNRVRALVPHVSSAAWKWLSRVPSIALFIACPLIAFVTARQAWPDYKLRSALAIATSLAAIFWLISVPATGGIEFTHISVMITINGLFLLFWLWDSLPAKIKAAIYECFCGWVDQWFGDAAVVDFTTPLPATPLPATPLPATPLPANQESLDRGLQAGKAKCLERRATLESLGRKLQARKAEYLKRREIQESLDRGLQAVKAQYLRIKANARKAGRGRQNPRAPSPATSIAMSGAPRDTEPIAKSQPISRVVLPATSNIHRVPSPQPTCGEPRSTKPVTRRRSTSREWPQATSNVSPTPSPTRRPEEPHDIEPVTRGGLAVCEVPISYGLPVNRPVDIASVDSSEQSRNRLLGGGSILTQMRREAEASQTFLHRDKEMGEPTVDVEEMRMSDAPSNHLQNAMNESAALDDNMDTGGDSPPISPPTNEATATQAADTANDELPDAPDIQEDFVAEFQGQQQQFNFSSGQTPTFSPTQPQSTIPQVGAGGAGGAQSTGEDLNHGDADGSRSPGSHSQHSQAESADDLESLFSSEPLTNTRPTTSMVEVYGQGFVHNPKHPEIKNAEPLNQNARYREVDMSSYMRFGPDSEQVKVAQDKIPWYDPLSHDDEDEEDEDPINDDELNSEGLDSPINDDEVNSEGLDDPINDAEVNSGGLNDPINDQDASSDELSEIDDDEVEAMGAALDAERPNKSNRQQQPITNKLSRDKDNVQETTYKSNEFVDSADDESGLEWEDVLDMSSNAPRNGQDGASNQNQREEGNSEAEAHVEGGGLKSPGFGDGPDKASPAELARRNIKMPKSLRRGGLNGPSL